VQSNSSPKVLNPMKAPGTLAAGMKLHFSRVLQEPVSPRLAALLLRLETDPDAMSKKKGKLWAKHSKTSESH
jgi:hypothetical protein